MRDLDHVGGESFAVREQVTLCRALDVAGEQKCAAAVITRKTTEWLLSDTAFGSATANRVKNIDRNIAKFHRFAAGDNF